MVKIQYNLGEYQSSFDEALTDLDKNRIMRRIEIHDYTVWSDSPDEITNRLGWLHIMDGMTEQLDRIQALVKAVEDDGYTNVLLLGMGGSSLAPEVFSLVFDENYGLALDVLDSTDPGTVLAYDSVLDTKKTLFIVSTKSGGTAETLSFFKYFYNRTLAAYDGDKAAAGKHFVGITDPGSKLEGISESYKFRDLFLNDPNIGGRYSVLSFFGLVPAALIGVDLEELLKRAKNAARRTNNAAWLGAAMGTLAKQGRDKLTIVASPQIESFGDWAEQLIAESTGKSGTGILPVVGEALASPDVYGDDRLFVYMRLGDDQTYDNQIATLSDAGHPVVIISLDGKYDLGGQFFLWEMATAVAGYFLQIQPFDQPNVESAKNEARAKIDEYMETGKLEQLEPSLTADGIQVIGDVTADSIEAALKNFLAQADDGAYISLHAYIQPTPATTSILKDLQNKLRDTTKLATTLGYGPRFLHSTGQLHKGDAGKGLFIQILADMPKDADIPDEAGADASGMSFGTLKEAQALGDRAALLGVDRHVLRFHLDNIDEGLQTLVDAL